MHQYRSRNTTTVSRHTRSLQKRRDAGASRVVVESVNEEVDVIGDDTGDAGSKLLADKIDLGVALAVREHGQAAVDDAVNGSGLAIDELAQEHHAEEAL